MERQKTIASEAQFSGIGVHTGNLTTMTFKPAPPNSGITFYRTDLPGKPAIKADVDLVVDISRGTTIGLDETVRVHTVEHALAAIAGLGIDNLDIEVDANETPFEDGSSLPFLSTLKKVGTVEQDAPRDYLKIEQPVFYRDGDITLAIIPDDEFRVSMTINYDHEAVGSQYASFVITPESFENEIASARTFCFLRDVRMLQDQGLIQGGSLESAIVIGDDEILNESLRYPNEFVRHKILDLVGDMYLLGRPIIGHVIAVKSGHPSHVEFSKEIRKSLLNGQPKSPAKPGAPAAATDEDSDSAGATLDINTIMQVIPHRYPVLLVDRILEYEPYKRAVGIKNVSVNEPFFKGHWPGLPVMPGVLIIEVMAQVSSVLCFGSDEDLGKVGFFLGIERAKFRRMVVPGDQMRVETTVLHMRRNAFKVKAVATVDGSTIAQAEILLGFMDTHAAQQALGGVPDNSALSKK
jgi:UDP-3-O-[3-hydroxymyristoyl] N-acetylglucosamine deacetylase/3-hydroxyacyl-[acyl-carrier-protein] dehydratase